jgi:arylsulfatase A-like enzyme
MRVLMLDIDGLQPAYLGPYGCEWAPTPTLDHWAATGVVFDQHVADCPDPAAGFGWRTGPHPFAGGGTDLLSGARAAGVKTVRVGPVQPGNEWDIDVPIQRDARPLELKMIRKGARQAIEQIGVAEHAFLRVEIDALLPPWRPSDEALADLLAEPDDDGEESEMLEPWTEELPERLDTNDDPTFQRIQTSYAAAVATLDGSLAKLLADCAKRGWGDNAVWILTAGRGFPLGEHGAIGLAAADLYEELVHLPLLLRLPNAEHAGHRVSGFTQPMDLAPTIRELFGVPIVPAADPWTGQSLVALARGGETPIRDRAVSAIRRPDRTLWGYRMPGWYLMLDDRPESPRRLFVKPDDRWEVNDVCARNQELAEELEREFRDKYR